MKVKVTLRNTFYRLYPSICTIFNIIFRSNKKKKSYDISYLKGTFSQGRVFDSYENIDIEINSYLFLRTLYLSMAISNYCKNL